MTTYRAPGESIDYTPGSDVTAGDIVVVGTLIGVAATAIASGDKDALRIEGEFRATLKSGDTPSAGSIVYWDGTNSRFTTTSAAGLVKALCVETVASGTVVDVRLTPGAGVGV